MRRRIDTSSEPGKCPPLPGETFEQRHGLTREALKAYERAHGVSGVLGMYERQRRGAWERRVPWEITLVEWVAVWGDKIVRRGQGKECLMMCRKDDKGPYRKDNVRLATPHENRTDALARHRLAGWASSFGKWFQQRRGA